MENIIIWENHTIQPNKEVVLQLLNCREENPVYDEILSDYEELLQEIEGKIHPAAAAVFGKILDDQEAGILKKGSEVLYVILTVGKEISTYSKQYFEQGDYVKGMLVDAMADSCLFSYEEEIAKQVKELCQKRKKGVSHRYEAPQDIPMHMQKSAFEALQAEQTLGLSITSGYMYDPIKSTCQIFELSDKPKQFRLEHDCSRCESIDCPMRQEKSVKIIVKYKNENRLLTCKKGSNLMEVLLENHVYINAVCGGNGKCKKCKICVVTGKLSMTREDKAAFSEKDLLSGMRLSCRAVVEEDCTITICQEDESDFHVVGAEKSSLGVMNQEYGIAIDIGTTTLAISLVGLQSGEVLDTFAAMNHQRTFGADVIARIQAFNEGKGKLLRESIQQDLLTGIRTLLGRNQIAEEKLIRFAIAGNTTMQHLLLGYSCENLGVYPFTPVSISMQKCTFAKVFETEEFADAEVFILPGNSAFVGADIMAGLYSCDFHSKEKICVLLDLGTNGEMAVGQKDRILVTSTAAGPAFEGGNIQWGVGSISGAICGVEIKEQETVIKTIEDRPAIGICGTGVIETVAELVRNDLVDETGVMDEDYFDEGYHLAKTLGGTPIIFTQKDVREIQLAKAAIRAGLETLLICYGASYEDIDKVYLAGGFGYYMDILKAVQIGMLPKELLNKTIAVGNTSLLGAIRFLREERDALTILPKIADMGEEVQLSSNRDFDEFYMEHMMFE